MDTVYSRYSAYALQDYSLEDILVADPVDGSLDVRADPVGVQGNLTAQNLGAVEAVVCRTLGAGAVVTGAADVAGSLAVGSNVTAQSLQVASQISAQNLQVAAQISAQNLQVAAQVSAQNLQVAAQVTTASLAAAASVSAGSLAVTGGVTAASATVAGPLASHSHAVTADLTCGGALRMGSNLVLGGGGALRDTVLEAQLQRLARTAAYSNLGAQNVQLWKGARLVAYPTIDPRLWFQDYEGMPGEPKVVVDSDGFVPWRAIKGAPDFDETSKGLSIAGLIIGGLGLAVGAASMFTGGGGIGTDLAKLLKDMVHGQDQYEPVDEDDLSPPLASDFKQLKHRPIAIPTDGVSQRLGIGQDVFHADTTRAYVVPATAFSAQSGNPTSAAFDATTTANRWLLLDYGARTMNLAGTAWTRPDSAVAMGASNDGLYAAGGVRLLDTGARTLDNLSYAHVAGDVVIDGRLRVGRLTLEPDGTILQDGHVLMERGRAQYLADAASSDRFISRFNQALNFDDSLI